MFILNYHFKILIETISQMAGCIKVMMASEIIICTANDIAPGKPEKVDNIIKIIIEVTKLEQWSHESILLS